MNTDEEQSALSSRKGNNNEIDHVDFSDALLWSDCPEELYLQNILNEVEHRRSQQTGNSNDSLMGDSTIVNLLLPPNESNGEFRRTIDWAPIAGSRATDDSPRDTAISIQASGIGPLKIDFNEAASSVETDPELVDEFDAEETVEMEKTKLSSLTADTWLRKIRPAANFTRTTWIPADKISLARQAATPTQPAASTKKPPLVVYTPSTKQSSIKIGEGNMVDEEDQEVKSSRPCCGFICRAREDDVFRRLINMAVCLLVAFVILATTAVIMSTTSMFTKETVQDASGYNDSEEATTFAPSRPAPSSSSTEMATVAPSPSPAPSLSNVAINGTSSPSDASTSTPSKQPTPQPTPPPTQPPTTSPSSPPVVDPTPKPTRIPLSAPSRQPSRTKNPTTYFPTSSGRPSSPPSSTADLTFSPTSAGTYEPSNASASPTHFEDDINSGAEYERIIDILRRVASDSTLDSIEEQASPQFPALIWLVWDLQQQPSLPENRIIQRWVLAVLFFGMNGPDWVRLDGWMTTANECLWFTTSSRRICDDDGAITHLDLQANNLRGTIPEEIALLSDSLERVFLNSNGITGDLPRSLGSLSNLERLHLTVNNIQGSIPRELGDLSNLEMLALGRNEISGTIPSRLGSNLGRLRLLDLAVNSIFGTIPSELGRLRRLTKLSVTTNDLSGTVPSDLSSLTRLTELKLSDNSLTGSIPSDVCSIESLEEVEVNCDEVLCSCCENCA